MTDLYQQTLNAYPRFYSSSYLHSPGIGFSFPEEYIKNLIYNLVTVLIW